MLCLICERFRVEYLRTALQGSASEMGTANFCRGFLRISSHLLEKIWANTLKHVTELTVTLFIIYNLFDIMFTLHLENRG